MPEKTYIITGTDEVADINYSEISLNSLKNVRLNNAGTKCIISYRGDQPSYFSGKTEYTATQMRAIANSSINEWYRPPSDMNDNSWYIRAKDVLNRYNPFTLLVNWLYTESIEE